MTLVDRDRQRTADVGRVRLAACPAGSVDRGIRLWRFDQIAAPSTMTLPVSPGVEFLPVQAPLELGAASSRLRIIDAWLDGSTYKIKVEGRRGYPYLARLLVPAPDHGDDRRDVRERPGRQARSRSRAADR